MDKICLMTHGPQETRSLGQALGCLLPPGTVIAAQADLGLGKTVFAQGLAAGLGITEAVTSPTFMYYEEYAGRLPFCHIDAYRLENLAEEELALIGLEECFLSTKTAFVEWPDFIAGLIPADAIWLTIRPAEQAENRRELCFHFSPSQHPWLVSVLHKGK